MNNFTTLEEQRAEKLQTAYPELTFDDAIKLAEEGITREQAEVEIQPANIM